MSTAPRMPSFERSTGSLPLSFLSSRKDRCCRPFIQYRDFSYLNRKSNLIFFGLGFSFFFLLWRQSGNQKKPESVLSITCTRDFLAFMYYYIFHPGKKWYNSIDGAGYHRADLHPSHLHSPPPRLNIQLFRSCNRPTTKPTSLMSSICISIISLSLVVLYSCSFHISRDLFSSEFLDFIYLTHGARLFEMLSTICKIIIIIHWEWNRIGNKCEPFSHYFPVNGNQV